MKTNTLFQTNKLKDFKVNLAYEEWLREFIRQPNNKELNQMENNFNSVNNISYNPIQGA
jgi:hypothetical protein